MADRSDTTAGKPLLTSTSGAPITDNQNSETAGPRGPVLMQDFHLLEKLAHQNRERVPERVVHAKGWGAHGTFTVTHDITRYSRAAIFAQVGKQTPMLARFSTVAGEMGAADHERDVRGFALKFYTEEGNWDLVGNNTPVFFVRDPLKFPDFIHTQKRHPRTNLRNPTAQWDFWGQQPEALHQVTILMSDRGIPQDPTRMHGFGSHTYSMWNAEGKRVWVKFHFKTAQGIANHTDDEAAKIIGKSRESYQEALFGKIERGEYPRWTLFIQVMDEDEAERTPFDPFDLTKVWPQGDYPLIEVGFFELNRNPDNYFAEIEQAAFSPANKVPGIGYSPDKMLQARVFSYNDAHRYRIGTHFEHLPVNRPQCPMKSYHLNGSMNFFGHMNDNPDAYYEPNSFGGPVADPSFEEPPLRLSGTAARHPHQQEVDDYTQVRALHDDVLTQEERERLYKNTAAAMDGADEAVLERVLVHYDRISPAYGAGIRKARAAAEPAKDPLLSSGKPKPAPREKTAPDAPIGQPEIAPQPPKG